MDKIIVRVDFKVKITDKKDKKTIRINTYKKNKRLLKTNLQTTK